MGITLNSEAFALRPTRINEKKNELIYYDAITFPNGPYAGCDVYLRRVALFGLSESRLCDVGLDVLNENGDIVQELYVTKKGFEYLRRCLKFRKIDA
jgi:hypothetical protein